jgi:hypothetical protein
MRAVSRGSTGIISFPSAAQYVSWLNRPFAVSFEGFAPSSEISGFVVCSRLDRRAAIESHAERSTRVSAALCDDQIFEFQKAKARQPRAPGALQNQIRISQAALPESLKEKTRQPLSSRCNTP